MILVVDNYDSFTFNLVQILATLDREVVVVRNDALHRGGDPRRAGPTASSSRRARAAPRTRACRARSSRSDVDVPLLGVCLGHQALGAVFGGRVSRAPVLMHGKTSAIRHDGRGIFEGLPNPFTATRYHSLAVERESVPDVLRVTATTDDGIVMGLAHRTRPLVGVQFHPESVLTTDGERLLTNFVAGRLS